MKQLSKDLIAEFPEIKGFSQRNLAAVKRWYLFWSSDIPILQQLVAKLENSMDSVISKQAVSQLDNSILQQTATKLFQIPWGHNIVIIQKCKDTKKALFYVNKV